MGAHARGVSKSCCSGALAGSTRATPLLSEEERATALTSLLDQRSEFVAFAQKQLGDAALAEDVVQASLLKASQRIEQLASAASARAWFYRLLRNAASDARRHRSAEQRATDAFEDEQPEEALTPAPERRVCMCVSRAMNSLKADYRDALQRVEVEGEAVKDFAREQDIQPGNAAVRLFRAREALKKKLQSTCGACATAGCYDCDCDPGVVAAHG